MYPKFTDYAVLGDDVLIADQAVAQKYHEVLGRFSVSIYREILCFYIQNQMWNLTSSSSGIF